MNAIVWVLKLSSFGIQIEVAWIKPHDLYKYETEKTYKRND
jgi:hypothetical protein